MADGKLFGHFAADGLLHAGGDFAGGEALAEEVHELGDGGLGGEVVAGDDAGVLEAQARQVALLVHTAARALGDVDYHLATVGGLADGVDEPGVDGGVAGAVGA